jgi:hypothetical protein
MRHPLGGIGVPSKGLACNSLETAFWEVASALSPRIYRLGARTAYRTGNSAVRSRRALILTPMLGPPVSPDCRFYAGWSLRRRGAIAGGDRRLARFFFGTKRSSKRCSRAAAMRWSIVRE